MSTRPASLSQKARRLPGASLLLASLALVVAALPNLASVLEFDRAALRAGQLWRLVSCHWTHWDLNHLLWDLVTFFVLAALCEAIDRRRLVIAMGSASLLIALAIWAVLPEIGFYRGLSGLDSTLFALYLGLVRSDLRSRGRAAGWTVAALSLLGAKVSYETITGQTLFVHAPNPDTVVVPLAHLVGGVVGCLAACLANSKVPATVRRQWCALEDSNL